MLPFLLTFSCKAEMVSLQVADGQSRVRCGVDMVEAAGWLEASAKVWWCDVRVDAEGATRALELNAELLNGHSIDYGRSGFEALQPVADEQTRALLGLAEQFGLSPDDFNPPRCEGLLGGPGAAFHVDLTFGEPGVIFAVTSISGRGRLSFPNIGVCLDFPVGRTVLFDPAQVHGLISELSEKVGEESFLVVSTTMEINVSGCRKMGLVLPERPSGGVDLFEDGVDHSSGAIRPEVLGLG